MLQRKDTTKSSQPAANIIRTTWQTNYLYRQEELQMMKSGTDPDCCRKGFPIATKIMKII
jgi:hypothetical protein